MYIGVNYHSQILEVAGFTLVTTKRQVKSVLLYCKERTKLFYGSSVDKPVPMIRSQASSHRH